MAPLRGTSLQNLSVLNSVLPRSLNSNVKCYGTIGLLMYGFLFMFISNIRPKSAP